ncbi:DNA topoisomerase I [Labilithrix luteola]|uniref:DNA topoisomerase 1 n=1 Tax=Labilithrix luteola TaxID=1391654 RepID=A0A0K1QCI1_9BACT|nr:type I DNA topoisomerase [Labilithrix luteola]AKV03454.1 DNA topoisomerase I [Labilithrix luteola]
MGKTLVVVESPAKAKTIKKYLGSGYEVLASKGHVKDLPKKMGIDIEKGFQETYEVVPGKEKVLAELKTAAQEAEDILLATDPDREGEAIAWHLAEELTGKPLKAKRVEFHEITKNGVQKGVASPRALDKHLYDAQRARRVLDRIVGYDVSALVWSKLAFGLSAGRVQSVALRLIVDREREIEAFVPEEYWNIGTTLAKTQKNGAKKQPFNARLAQQDGKKIEVKDGETAGRVKSDLDGATYRIAKITKSERKRKPYAPYTTSKLQQDAVNRLGFGAKRTMQVAQGLYEGVDLGKDGGPVGLITYMRTDSTRVSPDALAAAREYIENSYGKNSLPAEPNVFKSKKNSQDAHEAIRPTSLEHTPETVKKHLKDEQYKIYKLIWDRFIASQMKDAVFDQTSVDIEAKAKSASYMLRSSGRVLKFAGWLEVYGSGVESTNQAGGEDDKTDADGAKEPEEGEATLPELAEGEVLELVTPPGVLAEQKFTQPPARYNEGSLVRELEERGIGRPSTYAEIISKVQARDYVEKLDGRNFRPTLLGKMVVDGLVNSELDFMDPTFTSSMEQELDAVEAGTEERTVLLSRFYKKFREQLDKSKKGKRWNPDPEPTGEICEICGPNSEDEKLRALPPGEMMKRWSKNGWFLGCSNYPKCKNTRDLGPDGTGAAKPRDAGVDCDKCGKPMVIRSGRYGEFLSCTGYPQCKNARPVPLGVACPKCGGDIIEVRPKKKGGKTFYGCSRYNDETVKCDFKLWQKPINEPCPACGAKFLVMGGTKAKPMIACADKECGYKRSPDAPSPGEEHAPAAGADAASAAMQA